MPPPWAKDWKEYHKDLSTEEEESTDSFEKDKQ
jgi:hypothetical protein